MLEKLKKMKKFTFNISVESLTTGPIASASSGGTTEALDMESAASKIIEENKKLFGTAKKCTIVLVEN